MAKYADYAQAPSLDQEIDEAAVASASREQELPPQFQGKSPEEIARSYQELKEMTDRQANELGDLRKTQSQLTDRLLQSSPPRETAPEPEHITVDDLYLDPEAAIEKVVDQRVSAKLEALEQKQQKLESDRVADDFEEKFPGYQQEARSPEMQDWLKESGYRQRLAVAADGGDFQAAEDLFSMYYDLKGEERKAEDKEVRNQRLREATLESGRSGNHSPVEKFSRSKLELARRRAKRGDREAEQYLKENADAIFTAYEEGRLVN